MTSGMRCASRPRALRALLLREKKDLIEYLKSL